MLAAQDGDREAFTCPISRGAKAPPDANRVHDDDLEAGLQQLLHHHRRSIGFPSAALGQDGKGFAHRFSGKAQLSRDLEGHGHGSILSCHQPHVRHHGETEQS